MRHSLQITRQMAKPGERPVRGEKRRGGMAFTLIELLIVVAIIAILAAIAVPNFLEAQTRSKVSRAKNDLRTLNTAFMAYFTDHMAAPPGPNVGAYGNLNWATEHPGRTPEYKWRIPDMVWFYCEAYFHPLTTPVSYLTSIPFDAFTKRMPYAYDDFYDFTSTVAPGYAYSICASCGPDMVAGDWARPNGPIIPPLYDEGISTPYDPTNGTKSRGDVTRGMIIRVPSFYKKHYPLEEQ